ncbi:peptidoglycan -binding protein [Pseudopelagicola sp. nBUS_20]|uniref:peptidoglycan -binding protein n=1 Tax=Pseudopelagicola sp. nBUS_20 TaxID=3395317 RepID=UPI003EC0B371
MALSRRTGQRFQASIWPGFVDAMTGLLLVLMFVLTIFMVVQFVLRETITGQEDELNTLEEEVAALAEALGLEQVKSVKLETEVGGLKSTLSDSEARVQQQDALISALSADLDALNSSLLGARNSITNYEAQVAALLAQRVTTLGTIADLEGQRDALTAEREAMQAQRDAARVTIAGLEGQRDALTAEREAMQVQRDAARVTIADLEGVRNKLSAERESLMDERDAFALALTKARDEVDLRIEAARLAAARQDAMQALIEDINRKLADSEGREGELAAKVDNLEGKLTDEEAARLTEASAVAALRERLKNADAELTAMTLALELQRKKAEETLTMLAAARRVQEDLDLKLAAALVEGQDVSEDLSSAVIRLAAVEAALSEKERELVSTRSNLEGALIRSDDFAAQLARAVLALENVERDAGAKDKELASLRAELTSVMLGLEQGSKTIAELQFRLAASQAALEKTRVGAATEEGQLRTDIEALESRLLEALTAKLAAESKAKQAEEAGDGLTSALKNLEERLAIAVASRQAAESDVNIARDEAEALRGRLAAVIADKLAAQAALSEVGIVEKQLAAALAAKKAAEASSGKALTAAEEREALLRTAQKSLAQEEARSAEGLRKIEVLNQQIGALRTQLSSLQALLDDYKERDAAADVQLEALGSELNMALARAAAEERRRRQLEAAERERLELENAQLAEQTKDLSQYRSEFFGRLRQVLGTQEGVRIVGDRFVFASEVLFPPGDAELSVAGEAEIALVASILQSVAGEIPEEIDWIVRVDGHTDNTPIRSELYADNWELSQARALSVVRYMIEGLGVPPQRLSANGFGEYQPVDPANSAEARARNRRIELKFTER